MVVPLPAGGATDIWARLVAEPMAGILGQPVVIENRAGAGGLIGTEAVKNAPADGYTILFHIANFVQTPVVLRRWPYRSTTSPSSASSAPRRCRSASGRTARRRR